MIDLDKLDSAVLDTMDAAAGGKIDPQDLSVMARQFAKYARILADKVAALTAAPLPFDIPAGMRWDGDHPPPAPRPSPPAKESHQKRYARIDFVSRMRALVAFLSEKALPIKEIAARLGIPAHTLRRRYLNDRRLFLYHRQGVGGGTYEPTSAALAEYPAPATDLDEATL